MGQLEAGPLCGLALEEFKQGLVLARVQYAGIDGAGQVPGIEVFHQIR